MIPTLPQKTINQKLQIRFTIDYFLITNTLLLIEQNFYFVPHHRPDGSGADLGGAHPRPPEMTCGFLIQLVFCKKKNYVVYWF